ncbi:MAG: sodium:solute symporter [Calditrichaeota bacterium]|nr:sodium:solute symporter [Calditrichota bacterium]
MNSSQDWGIAGWLLLAFYVIMTLFFVIRGALKTKSISDYALGNINFSPVAVGLALAASMTSAATFIINPGFIALYGISAVISFAVVFPIAAVVSLVVLTKSFRAHGSNVKALSLAQWMGTRYNSPGYSLFFGFLSLLLITFIVLICVGLTKVISKTIGVSELSVLIFIVMFIFGYMMFGGANSMVYTNTIQAAIMIVVAVILLTSGYDHFSSGVHGFLDKLNAIDPKLTKLTNPDSFLFRDYFEIFITQIIVGVAVVCQPHIITKSLLLKSDKGVNRYLTVAVIVELLFFAVVITGLYARIAFPDLMVDGQALKMDGIISAYVIYEFPVWVGLIVVLGLISAGISTLEGLIQALATTVTNDIIKPVFKIDDIKKEIKLNKLIIILLAIVSIWLSYDQLINPKLSVAIFAQNGVYAYFAAAFVPIVFGMFIKEMPKIIPITASVVAVVVHFIMYYGKLPVPLTISTGENPGVAAATAIVASLITATVLYNVKKGSRHESV